VVIDLLVGNFWVAMGLWLGLMVLDNVLSMTAVRMYREGARRHWVLEDGSELNPLFQDDVVNREPFSPRFMLVVTTGYLLAWLVFHYGRVVGGGPLLFEFFAGLLLLVHGPIVVRHARFLLLFHHLRQSHGVQGRIFYDGWLTMRLAAVEVAVFAVLYLLVFVLTERGFFAGGAAGSAVMALSHWRVAPPAPPRADERADDGGP